MDVYENGHMNPGMEQLVGYKRGKIREIMLVLREGFAKIRQNQDFSLVVLFLLKPQIMGSKLGFAW